MQENFNQSLFGCFDNCSICLLACCCPCLSAGKIAEKTGNSYFGCCMLTCCLPPVGGIVARTLVRKSRYIKNSLLEDILVGWCCTCCSLAQCQI
ncbi:hypothetical protein HZS_7148, partial [Henneguya salminicola]